MPELIAGILVAAGLVVFVLRPIFRPASAERATGDGSAIDEGEDPEDDLSPPAVALRALKEIEFDRATGKLADQDYTTLKAKYTAAALAALRAGVGTRDAGRSPASAPASHPPRLSPRSIPACPTHGPRPESDAGFCSECGRRLAVAQGYCTRCGTALESEAQYCHSCGARVAA